ncbi:unnamed protein product [Acanthoscelides obtectus]|uniref:UV radiation resistance-associated gene protein n=1 Tax=Acanthoscelides obtectus TaxID=200917 RepID=A0A9P0PU71_ACAOB|nr:unnamed protein product [Acanthoscelides obtectus]CAK1653336.1 UV radiation resistance-associated gene protein [Acanthoscelides obtectus]
MNFTTPEYIINRQRCQQWVPLITQQYRLRHVYQIMCFNLLPEVQGRFYYTLHTTTMSAPFYTSGRYSNPHPKWSELDLNKVQNTSASCIVLRIWQCDIEDSDKIVLTWGVHFSGLVYIGNKIADIQPHHFKNNTVIFYMLGGYFTSHHMIRTDLQKPVPFHSSMNISNKNTNETSVCKRLAMKVNKNEVHNSYNIQKLRKLQSLQLQIKNKCVDVQNIRDKINALIGNNVREDNTSSEPVSSPSSTVRYAPQLLTMNSLNKMLQEKPTGVQKQEMQRISKIIELARFRTQLLSQEKDRKTVTIRQLKQTYMQVIEENDERNSELMENYRKLSRGGEKLKDYKKSVSQHKELHYHVVTRLQQRKRELLQGLLFLYPIEKKADNKYIIHGVHLPNSDVLMTDNADLGVSVALGYVTHVLIMSSAFLHVPLRYQLTHYGSRSYITDTVSPLLPEKERDFPLFTKGKDKAQFTYAVYLLNKNIAQLRWLYFMNTNDLRATLHNLLTFLQGQREPKTDALLSQEASTSHKPEVPSTKTQRAIGTPNEKNVSLHSLNANSNISDPVLDSLRQDNQAIRLCSPSRRLSGVRSISRLGSGGLSEALAMPEAYLNRQIGVEALRNFIVANDKGSTTGEAASSVDNNKPQSAFSSLKSNLIKITKGKEAKLICDNDKNAALKIERGHDPLNPDSIFSNASTKSLEIHSDSQLNKDVSETRISRSMDTFHGPLPMRVETEVGSEPQLERLSEIKNRISVSTDNDVIQFEDTTDLGSEPQSNNDSETTITSDQGIQKNADNVSCQSPVVSSDAEIKSKTVASYTEQEDSNQMESKLEPAKEPQLDQTATNRLLDNSSISGSSLQTQLASNCAEGEEEIGNATTQKEFLEKWMQTMPVENLYLENSLSASPGTSSGENPLTARTDALLSTKSFNLVKPK